jgi:hypothetical protein
VRSARLVFGTILITGCGRIFLGLLAHYSRDLGDGTFATTMSSLPQVLSVTGVVILAAMTGLLLLRKASLPITLPPALGECICAAAAALAFATSLPQLPAGERWWTTAAATALALAELFHVRRTGVILAMLRTALIVVAGFDLMFCLVREDLLQLGLLAAIVAMLTVIAASRQRIPLANAATTVSCATQIAIVLVASDGFVDNWTAAIALAVVGACSIGFACLYVGLPPERAALVPAGVAVALAELTVLTVSPNIGTGVVLTIAAAPLVAYGKQPGRRPALLLSALMLTAANTAFVLGSGATTMEWFTLPPAVLLIAVGLLGWRDQSSWVFLGPGLLLGLVPSALIANSDDGALRLALVVAAAVAITLVGVRFSLQAPFVIGAAVLAKLGVWQFLQVAPMIPRWITLGLAGAILLGVGASYERRLQEAKQAARWVTALR